MPGGRPRKPVEEHVANGTYRKDRHGVATVAAPLERVTAIEKPTWLPKDLAPAWAAVTADLCAMGALVPSDLVLLEQAFRMMGNARGIQGILDLFLVGGGDDDEDVVGQISKLSSALATQVAGYERILGKFGITPAARASLLHLLPRPKGDDTPKKSIKAILTKK
jgi:phage terminase small subunit